MTMLSDQDIVDRCINQYPSKQPMIEPFISYPIKEEDGHKIVSYGTSAYGYDMRLGFDFKIFTNVRGGLDVIDPKNFNDRVFIEYSIDESLRHQPSCPVVIPPNSFALGVSMEYFRIPRDIVGICLGKSTYARCGIIVNITPLEPEWEGFLTIEISNTAPLPAIVYPGEGIAQVIFFHNRHGGDEKIDRVCRVSYKDKGGKYDKQVGLTTARV